MLPLLIVLGVIVLLVVVFVAMYNGLVKLRNRVDSAWSQIDVQLQRRHDLIPNLVETVKGYAAHERETLDAVIQARNTAVNAQGPHDQAQAENMLTGALRQLFALAEAYPDLKANQGFTALQHRISELENQIADRREYYNDTVTTFNTRIQQVPDVVVANWLSFTPEELFKIAASDREDVPIRFSLAG